MKKELENLQDAVNSINISEAMQMEIIQKVKTATKRKKLRFSNVAALADDLKDQKVDGDGFTRAYTEEEERKMAELTQKYQEGIFPEGELAQTENAEEAERLGFCFLVPDSTFYLPDRELTEEEMLQIIDFYAKRDYALAEQYREEHADEIAKQKKTRSKRKRRS